MAVSVFGVKKLGWSAALSQGWDKLAIVAVTFILLTFTKVNPSSSSWAPRGWDSLFIGEVDERIGESANRRISESVSRISESANRREDCAMRFFDAHCDAVMHIEDGDFDFVAGKGRSHMDLPRLLAAGHCAQVFAIFAAASYYPGRDLRAFAERAIAAIHGWADASDGRMQVVRSAAT